MPRLIHSTLRMGSISRVVARHFCVDTSHRGFEPEAAVTSCRCSMVRNGSAIGQPIGWHAGPDEGHSHIAAIEVFARCIGGVKSPRDITRRDRRQRQRDNERYGPRKAGAAVHWQNHPLMMMSAVGKKGSTRLADAGLRWLSCQRRRGRQCCAALDLLRIETTGPKVLLRAHHARERRFGRHGSDWLYGEFGSGIFAARGRPRW